MNVNPASEAMGGMIVNTFGEQVIQLALSIDVIDDQLLDGITDLIDNYLRQSLSIQNAKVMIYDRVDGEVGFMRHSLKGLHSEIVIPLKKEDGSWYGQTAASYEKKKPMWIVSAKGRQNLETCDGYADMWSGLKKIPKYKIMGETEQPVKTRIIVPIKTRRNKRAFGALTLESSEYLDITMTAKDELKRIADSLSIVIRAFKTTVAHQKRTDEAISSLKHSLLRPLPNLKKPLIFLAYSEHAEKDVTEIITRTIKEEFSDKVIPVNWKDMEQPGNINKQLVEAISNCRYAICYLSRKKNEGDGYRDNRNVIFEAGMFHGRTEETSALPSMWIPVREKNSPKPPFDFAQERILLVERNKDGSLKQKIFANKFRDRVAAMLDIP